MSDLHGPDRNNLPTVAGGPIPPAKRADPPADAAAGSADCPQASDQPSDPQTADAAEKPDQRTLGPDSDTVAVPGPCGFSGSDGSGGTVRAPVAASDPAASDSGSFRSTRLGFLFAALAAVAAWLRARFRRTASFSQEPLADRLSEESIQTIAPAAPPRSGGSGGSGGSAALRETPAFPPDSPTIPMSPAGSTLSEQGTSGFTSRQIGQYLLLAKLGEGAMGVVYRARQTDLRRDVALKMLHPDQETEDRRRRFLEEARSAARLRHANFVHVYDLGTADGHVFIAMELVEGGTLADRLRQSRPTFWQAAQEVLTLARAMQTAHEAGIVHRDIKPSNVMVTADGQLKISDFGLARRLDAQVRQTAAGKLLGTPAYMAPEQARGENDAVGPATDVYALGAVLYELLTGRTPFRARSVPEVLRLIVEADPVPPDRIATGSCRPPRDLATICLKCLSKKPGQRYGSAAALAEDLERFLAGLPVLARPVGRLERLRRRICRHPWHFATAALLLVGAVIAGGGVWNHLQYHRESVSHFRDYSVRWQVIEGLHPISASEAARRYQSVRITRKGYRGPVIRAEIVDGAGRPHPHEWLIESSLRPTAPGAEQQVVTVEYPGRTAENDRVVDAIAYNRQGHRVWAMHFTDYPYTCHYTFSSRLGSSAGGTPRPPAAGQSGGQRGGERAQDRGLHPVFTAMVIGASPARFIQFEYRDDGSGLASRELFFDERDRTVMPQPNADGAYGFQYEYDARGNVVVLRQLNAEYREGPNDIGVSRKVFTHYPNGERKSERYFHGERPVIPLNHITAGLDYEYDEQGNPIRVHLRNAEGERPDEPGRAAYFVHEFGPNGELLSRSLRDVRGTKNVSLDQDLLDEYGFGAAREQRWKYADDGTITQVRFVDENGELVAAGEGVAGWNSEYQDGFEIRRVCVAPDGKPPARTTAGNLGWTAVYEDGRLVSKTYFGYEIGSPKAREDYDRDGNIIRTRYLANDEKTLMSDIDGTAGWDATFEGGHEAKREWVGTDGKSPQRNKYDTLGYTSRYTDGQLVSQTYFGYRSGSPKLQNMFDREGNIVSVRRLANDEKTLIVEDDGIAGWDNTYQDGTLTKCVWVGPDGKPPQRNTSGSLGYTADYVDGRLASQTYFGYEEGFGISAQRDEFDEEGNRIRGRYLAADGESFTIHPQEGIAGWNSTFENGLETERMFVDQNGNPGIRGNQGAIGWKATYANGVLVSKLSYGYVGDAPKVRSEFDVEGNLIRQRYLADDEQTLVIDPDHGTAGCDITIEDGQQVECVWVGPNGKPPWRHNLGHLGFKSEYREGRLSSKTYFGYSAEAGRAMQREELDAAGNVVRVRYLAEDGKTAVIKPDERIAGWNSTFENGREVKQVYVGLDGQPPQHHSDGSQGYTKSYDGNRAISQTYFGFKEGYLWRDELDAAGNIFRTSFLGKDGITPIVHPVYGIASWKSYYEGGAQVRREHFDLKGQPIRTLAVVEEVFPGSQAAAKGVKVGDLFLEYDGVRGSAMELIHAVRKAGQQTGEPVMVKFLRKGEVLTREFARGTVGIRAQDFAVDRLKESEPERVPPAEQTTAVQPGVFRETDRRNSELVTGVRSRVF